PGSSRRARLSRPQTCCVPADASDFSRTLSRIPNFGAKATDGPSLKQRSQQLGLMTVVMFSCKADAKTPGCIASTSAAASSPVFGSVTLLAALALDWQFSANRFVSAVLNVEPPSPRRKRMPVHRLPACAGIGQVERGGDAGAVQLPQHHRSARVLEQQIGLPV